MSEKKKKKKFKFDPLWVEAKKRCRLNQEDIRKAKELGMKPKSLIKLIPNKDQLWKAPVKVLIEDLHAKRFGYEPDQKKKRSTPLPADKQEITEPSTQPEEDWDPTLWADSPPAETPEDSGSAQQKELKKWDIDPFEDKLPF